MAIRSYLAFLPILNQPREGERLYVYLVATSVAVSSALVRTDEQDVQQLIYFVRKTLLNAETRYAKLEKVALALRTTAKNIRPYFQAHAIVVLTDQPMQVILHKEDLSGRLVKWAIELGEFGIEYRPWQSLKGQVLVDFIIELPRYKSLETESIKNGETWIKYVVGSSKKKDSKPKSSSCPPLETS